MRRMLWLCQNPDVDGKKGEYILSVKYRHDEERNYVEIDLESLPTNAKKILIPLRRFSVNTLMVLEESIEEED